METLLRLLDFIIQVAFFFAGLIFAFIFSIYAKSHEGLFVLPAILVIALVFCAFLGFYHDYTDSSPTSNRKRWFFNRLILSIIFWPTLVFSGIVSDDHFILMPYIFIFAYLLILFVVIKVRKKLSYRRALHGTLSK